MNFAKEDYLPYIFATLQKYKKDVFPYVRQDYVRKKIKEGNVIWDKGVVIIFGQYKRRQKIGSVEAAKGDYYISEIASSDLGSPCAYRVLKAFFDWCNKPVWLTVRTKNQRACKFYERNGMWWVGDIAWKENTIIGRVYLKEKQDGEDGILKWSDYWPDVC